MKITTDNLDIEMTMEEFENILNKGMLDTMITIIASLSDRMGAKKNTKSSDDELTSLLNDILKDETNSDIFSSLCDDEDYDCDDDEDDDFDLEDELDQIDEQNETVRRIYQNIFKNGER